MAQLRDMLFLRPLALLVYVHFAAVVDDRLSVCNQPSVTFFVSCSDVMSGDIKRGLRLTLTF